MQVRACTSRRIVCSLAAGLFTLPALAGTPAALDHVPTDAQAVIVVPNFGELLNDINTMNLLMGDQGEPMVMMVTSMVRGMPGINLDGSFAGVLSFEEGEDEPEVVFLVPVSDFGAFSQGHAQDEGIYEFDMGDEMLYFRDAGGGFVVMGDDDDLVDAYDATAGNLKAHETLLGKAGGRIAAGNDLFVYANFDAFDAEIAQGLEELASEREMVEMQGGAEAAAGFDAFIEAVESIANDGSSFAMGLNFDAEAGIAVDVGLQFKEDSTSASYLNNEGDAGKYFNNVPAMDYFFASAFDMSGEGIQRFMKDYIEIIEQFDESGMLKDMNLSQMISGMKGGIEVMGASDNIMGGLFNNTVYYAEVDDADKFIDFIHGMYDGMNESFAQLEEVGIEVNAAMDKEPTSINGVDAYGYSFAMDMSEISEMTNGMGGPNPAMIMGMIFGGDNGPSGYIAKAGDGLVSTLSKDAEFFAKVAAGANGNNTMKGNASMAHTASMLPSNRIMETYIAADHLINTAGPLLMMFGVLPEFEPIDALAPLGMAMTADGGGLFFRTALPIETIGAMMELIPEDAFEDNDEDMEF